MINKLEGKTIEYLAEVIVEMILEEKKRREKEKNDK